jgi:hypothetical protein
MRPAEPSVTIDADRDDHSDRNDAHTHERFAETATSILLLRADNGFQRFHTS